MWASRRSCEIDENGNEDQDRVCHQADEAESECHELPDHGRDLGGPHIAQAARQQGPQHPPAVHRKSGDHVEHREKKVHGRQPVNQRNFQIVDRCRRAGVQICAEAIDQHRRDHDIDERPGDGDEKFLPRFFRNALELRHTADRQKGYVRRRHAEGASGKNMTELVQQYAEEQKQHKHKAIPGRRGASRGVAGCEDPGEKQQEGEVDADNGACHLADIQRPGHGFLVWPGPTSKR